jgi:oligosaccharyltransferase complex subunit delta (ribophorin II)
LAEKVGKAPPLKPEEVVKFTNYLLSRKGVPVERGACLLVEALTKLTTNPYHVPVTFTLASHPAVLDDSKAIKIRIANVLGASAGTFTIFSDELTQTPSGKVVVPKKQLTKDPKDPSHTLFTLDVKDTRFEPGFYNAQFSMTGQDKKLVGTSGMHSSFKVPTQLAVENAQLGVFERDLKKPEELTKIATNTKLSKKLELNAHQKVHFIFDVKDKTSGTPLVVHQAFVVFVHDGTKREIVYVAEPSSTSKQYAFDLDLQKHEKDFIPGTYGVRLILGDPISSNAVDWHFADANIAVAEAVAKVEKKSQKFVYDKLPEIEHKFREQEPRPVAVVSDAFTVICAAPLLLLLALWLRVGINFGNIQISLWSLGFHAGLAAIFGLYFLFWLQLNAFETLKYLAVIGIPTFFCGNRLLRSIAVHNRVLTE